MSTKRKRPAVVSKSTYLAQSPSLSGANVYHGALGAMLPAAVAAPAPPSSKYLELLRLAKVESQGPRPVHPGPSASKEQLMAYQAETEVSSGVRARC
jgi:hypothetical protein